MSLRRTTLVIVGVSGLVAVLFGTATGTPSSPLDVETGRGPLVDRELAVNMAFDPHTRVKLQTKGDIELAVQRVVAEPGETFGWHTHPGPTLVNVRSGTLTLYHDERCSEGTEYATGTSFSNLPHEVHLARNNGATNLVVFAVYFLPAKTPPVAIRIDQPSPGPGCPG
jgi:quercetin dioxygenase-like cupin family protein